MDRYSTTIVARAVREEKEPEEKKSINREAQERRSKHAKNLEKS